MIEFLLYTILGTMYVHAMDALAIKVAPDNRLNIMETIVTIALWPLMLLVTIVAAIVTIIRMTIKK
jgi:hypothetical protein